MRRFGLSFAVGLGLLASICVQSAFAQRRGWSAGPAYPRFRLVADQGKGKAAPPRGNFVEPRVNPSTPKNQPNLRGMAGLPSKWVQNLQDMSPEEQEQFLKNNQQFQNLPPQRQAQIRQNLQNWNRLAPAQREAIRNREAVLERLTPQQRLYIRNVLLPEWQQMPQDRRQLINGRLRVLQGMSPIERQAAMDNPKFMQGLSPNEQSVLRDLNSLRYPANP